MRQIVRTSNPSSINVFTMFKQQVFLFIEVAQVEIKQIKRILGQ